MEDLTKLDIVDILDNLESGYDIIESNLIDEQTDFLSLGDSLLNENELPDIDFKLTLKDYLQLLSKNKEE
jgi:hypothetical protein